MKRVLGGLEEEKEEVEEELPSVIGGYTVSGLLGKGAYSTVYLGVKDNDNVALKVMSVEGTDWEKEVVAVQRLANEEVKKNGGEGAKLILGMKELVDLRPEHDKVCLIMERMQGQELQKLIPKNGLPEAEARLFFRQVLLALLYCHSQMVIHRDIKPDNIFVDGNGAIKLFDFGVSSVIKPGSFSKRVIGTHIYTAPEVLRFERYIGPEIDTWSMGVTLYTVVCGEWPWKGETGGHQMQSIMALDYSIPERISEECQDLIKGLLKKEPRERITLTAAVKHPWLQAGGWDPVLPSIFTQKVEEVNPAVLKKLEMVKFNGEEAKKKITSDPTSLEYLLYQMYANAMVL